MYYKKLQTIYSENELSKEFSISLLDRFDDFLRRNHKKDYLSPYQFALENDISVEQSVRFLMYYSGKEGILDVLPFVDCLSPTCHSSRIFLNDMDEYLDNRVICEDCGRTYSKENILPFIKVYFDIKDGVGIPPEKK
ncbi:hypothetical protein [Brevibacillus sp. NRS-1366]|uniref:hypothetical protein n=1 Tax=Brevibacillus sp. NRS-1366 TaxID=3233899 RepID=UPI003D20F576